MGPVTISDRGAGASSRGPSPDRGRDRSRFKLVAGLGGAGRRLARGAWASRPVLWYRGAGRREELNHTHSPAPDTCPAVPPRCWRACPPSVTRLCMGTRQRPPLTTLAWPVGARGVCRENFLKTHSPHVFVRLLSRARRRFWCHVLLFCRDFGTRLCLLVPGEPRLRAGLVALVLVRLSGTAPLTRRRLPFAVSCPSVSPSPPSAARRRRSSVRAPPTSSPLPLRVSASHRSPFPIALSPAAAAAVAPPPVAAPFRPPPHPLSPAV